MLMIWNVLLLENNNEEIEFYINGHTLIQYDIYLLAREICFPQKLNWEALPEKIKSEFWRIGFCPKEDEEIGLRYLTVGCRFLKKIAHI